DDWVAHDPALPLCNRTRGFCRDNASLLNKMEDIPLLLNFKGTQRIKTEHLLDMSEISPLLESYFPIRALLIQSLLRSAWKCP
ncbi:hypothetical protein, partial [Pseudomonas agarici]